MIYSDFNSFINSMHFLFPISNWSKMNADLSIGSRWPDLPKDPVEIISLRKEAVVMSCSELETN